jgi:hypothetical protein
MPGTELPALKRRHGYELPVMQILRRAEDRSGPCSVPEPSELPRGFGVRWLAGNGADTALAGLRRVEAKAVCALTPHPPHSKTLARGPGRALVPMPL